ncbi:hypothetical protein ACRRS0_13595 [Agarivorans sp. QJM3NY_29]|uniref:hypothetical protein n=1 Tax=unclassified Agarivorans TaxID=2636026 RepID=UPI003D7C6672
MKGIISGVLLALALSGCAMTRPSVEEVIASYHSEINTPYKEDIRQELTQMCEYYHYTEIRIEASCYLSGDVLVRNVRLTNNRWTWNPQAATSVTNRELQYSCHDTLMADALQSGFALLINLEGPNGFAGRLKTYDDCLNL